MPDGTPILDQSATCWADTVAPGHVLLFHFPDAENAAAPEPAARPCLVVETPEIDGETHAVLVYGTSQLSQAAAGYEVRLRKPADHRRAGLDEPTRFVAARRLTVPLTHEGFAISPATGSPVLGRLSGPTRARMNAVRARLAADAGTYCRGRRRQLRVRDRDFTVEVRQPRRARKKTK